MSPEGSFWLRFSLELETLAVAFELVFGIFVEEVYTKLCKSLVALKDKFSQQLAVGLGAVERTSALQLIYVVHDV